MKGTSYKDLLWAYSDERSRRKLKYVKSSSQKPDYNRKLHKPYRCEKVMTRLFRLEIHQLKITSSQQEASNAEN
ncbi:MarR family transcriptional regulator [Proteus terrae subsp. cibarius]|nr:MarR family transcriptional regulator [Proteus terrae subsp. cibarius]QGW02785.1 MarR family transcriptional regulator [Proteus terrae subsp. cibarius]